MPRKTSELFLKESCAEHEKLCKDLWVPEKGWELAASCCTPPQRLSPSGLIHRLNRKRFAPTHFCSIRFSVKVCQTKPQGKAGNAKAGTS